MAMTAQDLLVLAESPVRAEAGRFARRLGATAAPVEISNRQAAEGAKRFLLYLRGDETPRELKAFLRKAAGTRYETIVLYSAERAPRTAAKWGMVLGETQPKRTHLCFEPAEVADLLKLKPATDAGNDIGSLRKRLGITQEQLASALRLSARTIQNWESGVGLSQMKKRARDIFEFVGLLDDYIPESDQAKWLRTANEALGGRKPLDALIEGRIHELTIEFRRMQEGQPG